jgi:hypothetical protein
MSGRDTMTTNARFNLRPVIILWTLLLAVLALVYGIC